MIQYPNKAHALYIVTGKQTNKQTTHMKHHHSLLAFFRGRWMGQQTQAKACSSGGQAAVRYIQMRGCCLDDGDKTILSQMPNGEAVMPRQTGKHQHTYRPLGKRLGYAKLGNKKKKNTTDLHEL